MSDASVFKDVLSTWEARETEDFCELVNDALGRPDAAWEFGPDPLDDDKMLFSISLRNDPDWTTAVSKRLGIPFQHGEVGATLGIPPRHWDRYFEYMDRDNQVREIDGETWAFRMSPADDPNMVRLSVFADLPPSVDWFDAVSIMLTGDLGERNVAERIDQVERIDNPQGSYPLADLRAAFARRFPGCHYFAVLSKG